MRTLGEKISRIVHPETHEWSEEERETLKKKYSLSPSSHIASSLERTEEDVENMAKLLGLQRFSHKDHYRISEVLRLSGISYTELQQALFRGDLKTKIQKPSRLKAKKITRAILIEGDSLIRFLDERDKGIRKQSVVRRADKYMSEVTENEEEKANYRTMLKSGKIFDPITLLSANAYMIPRLAENEETDLLEIKDTDSLSRNDLIEANLGFAFAVAYKYGNLLGNGTREFIDDVHDAMIGLIIGVDKYDKARKSGDIKFNGCSLSTYIYYWMRSSLTWAQRNESRTIRIPSSLYYKLKKVDKAINYFLQQYGRNPSDEEVVEANGMSPAKVRKFLESASRPIFSLETEIEDKRSKRPHDSSMKDELREKVEQLMENLSSREREILKLRFGFYDDCEYSLEEVGKVFNLTRERIRQIEKAALDKFRNRKELESYLYI